MFPEWVARGGVSRALPEGSEGGIEARGGAAPPCCRGPGLTGRLGRARASSRSPRAERWRRQRRRRRRRGRCSQLGREPCQENTTSQLCPSIPAAVRTVTRPPALLPPLSPRLGPIVWLGAPAATEEGRGGEEERDAKKEGRRGVGGRGEAGSPALRGPSPKSTPKIKLFQSKHLFWSPSSPTVGFRFSKEGRRDPGG